MRLQAADIDWSQLDDVERNALEQFVPLLEDGYSYSDIADRLSLDAGDVEEQCERLAARMMALSGSIELPALSEEEYEALKQSIADHGQQMPILRGAASSGLPGEIIDGRHRRRACAQLRIDPKIVDVDGTADQLRSLGLVLNLARRHMSASSRRGVVKAKLLADPTLSDRAIAAAVGVSHPTVAAVRRELEVTGTVERSSTRTGADGVAQPVRERAPQPPPTHRSIRVLVPNDLFEQYVGDWVSCRAFRLLEQRPGVHELQVQLLDAAPAAESQLEQVREHIAKVAAKTNVDEQSAIAELLRVAGDVFGRPIENLDDLQADEATWLVNRVASVLEGTPA